MKSLILAGGLGTRLKDTVKDVPKPMASILGKPFLEHQIRFLKSQGITEFILAVHHMSDQIKSFFGHGMRLGVEITYSDEEIPLGTGGAIKNAQKYIDDTFIVLNGDSYSQIDLKKFLEFHKSKRSKSTMALTTVEEASNYGTVILEENKITGFIEKNSTGNALVNSGVYIFEPQILDYIESGKHISLEREVFPKLAKEGLLYGYLYDGYFMDIGLPETYQKFKDDALGSLFMSKDHKLREAISKMYKMGIDIILVVDDKRMLLGVITENIISKYLFEGGSSDASLENVMVKDPVVALTTDEESKIQELLLRGIYRLPIVDEKGIIRGIEFKTEKIKKQNFPIVRGRAPLRISFAGGGTDLPYFFEKYGGAVTNATIDKYCYASIIKRADSKIIINSDLTDDLLLDSRKDIIYDGKFDIVKAIINIMKPDFGFELYLHNDIPPGRGLGSSATLAVLLVSLISYLQDANFDDYKVADIAYRAERDELKIKGGWQDQYAAVTGGFNFMEFNQGQKIIYPLRLKTDLIYEFNSHLTLCYVGGSHFSSDLHSSQEKNFISNEEEISRHLNDLKLLAIKIKDCLLTNQISSIGPLLHDSWENKKKLNTEITNQKINHLYEIGLRNGAQGGRLLGAGGGGYILFFNSPLKRNQLKKALEKENGEIINFNFEFGGTVINPVKN